MKVIYLSKDGVQPATPSQIEVAGRKFPAFTHGQRGRGRWQVVIPVFGSVPEDGEYTLLPTGKDPSGQNRFAVKAGQPDGKVLVFWSLSPGFRGHASYTVAGSAKVIASGREAQGDAGRMGGAECPVLLVSGDCELRWTRTGRLYGEPAKWVAEYKSSCWTVATEEEIEILKAASCCDWRQEVVGNG